VSGLPGMERYPHVFQPLRIGPIEVRNRIYMGPHGTPMDAPTPGREAYHVPATDTAYYFAERAAGGVGLIFHSMQAVIGPRHHTYNQMPTPPEAVPSYRRVAELVHAEGAKIMAQIWYLADFRKGWEKTGPEAPLLGPSPIQHFNEAGSVSHQLRKDEIRKVIDIFGRAVRNLREAGYDGVEIHASHGSIHEHFLSAHFNHREDEYGGSVENRVRFLKETLEVVREQAGPEMATGIRLTADELLPAGFTEEGAREIVGLLSSSELLDFVDLDIGVEPQQPELMVTTFFLPKLHNAERVRNVGPAAKPLLVLSVPGQLTNLQQAERLLSEGICDMVGAVRGLIAEPRLVRNALEGKESESRTCIAANHCVQSLRDLRGFGCAINPAVAKEEHWGARHNSVAPRSLSVCVVGAGPAGLEAARTAALRGHRVSLLERRHKLGGALALWAGLPGREHLADLIAWYEARFEELSIDVRIGVEADVATIVSSVPDVVIVATGATYSQTGESGFQPTPISGWQRDLVTTPEPVINGDLRLSGRVIVLDEEGLHAAAGVAELAALAGAEVELVTRAFMPFGSLAFSIQNGIVAGRLREAGVRVRTGSYLRAIGDRSVTVFDVVSTEEEIIDEVDHVVMAAMRKPHDELVEGLQGRAAYVYVIGDALAPRGLREAIYEGHRFARVIGEESMPATVIDALFEPIEYPKPAVHA
jgi:2,4-dienoyl-CoA reductase-like NADH-dependent reductase (Old Yellow Enzyme family)